MSTLKCALLVICALTAFLLSITLLDLAYQGYLDLLVKIEVL